jgi:hypothetical protein
MVETNGLRASGLDKGTFREQQVRETPLGRIAQPEDIALAITFLASDDARWITGHVIVAAGGKTNVILPVNHKATSVAPLPQEMIFDGLQLRSPADQFPSASPRNLRLATCKTSATA